MCGNKTISDSFMMRDYRLVTVERKNRKDGHRTYRIVLYARV